MLKFVGLKEGTVTVTGVPDVRDRNIYLDQDLVFLFVQCIQEKWNNDSSKQAQDQGAL